MGIDLSRFKVVHGDKVFNAIALMDVHMPENVDWDKRDIVLKPKFIDILAINEDGNIISIHDEAWTFLLCRSSQAAAGHKVNGSECSSDLY